MEKQKIEVEDISPNPVRIELIGIMSPVFVATLDSEGKSKVVKIPEIKEIKK